MRDYYKILGLEKGADLDEVRSAYHALAKRYHPDTAMDGGASEDRFQEIAEAYAVLSDPQKRRQYDSLFGNDDDSALDLLDLEPTSFVATAKPRPTGERVYHGAIFLIKFCLAVIVIFLIAAMLVVLATGGFR